MYGVERDGGGGGGGLEGWGGCGGWWTRAAISRVPEHWPRPGKVKLGRGGNAGHTAYMGSHAAGSTNI